MAEQQRYVANAFAIVGFSKMAPRYSGRQLSIGVELTDPDILFFYPVHDEESRSDLLTIVRLEFCRSDGFRLLAAKPSEQPIFTLQTLTKAPRCCKYVAILTFQESHIVRSTTGFVPKFLVLVSDINMPDFFERCLNYLYNTFFTNKATSGDLNMAIAMLVKNVCLPPSPSIVTGVNFGLPGDNKNVGLMAISTPGVRPFTKTGVRIYRLFYQIGITFAVDAFLCLINEMRVIVFSKDEALLTDCCEALISLLWPLSYNNIYAPVVGKRVLVQLLKSRTPFFVGTCSLMPEEKVTILQQDGVVLVDLEEGTTIMTEKMMEKLVDFEDPVKDQLLKDLTAIFSGKDVIKDWNNDDVCELNNDNRKMVHAESIAKRIRACFLRMLATMLSSYRRSMTIVRFFGPKGLPQPAFYFDTVSFLGDHGLETTQRCLFLQLISGFFESFFQERFFPFRKIDFFDEMCASFANLTEDSYENADAIDQIVVMLTKAEQQISISKPRPVETQIGATFPQPDATEIARNRANCSGRLVSEVMVNFADKKRVPVGNEIERKVSGTLSSKEWEFIARSLDVLFSTGITQREEKIFKTLNWIEYSADRRKFCMELSRRATTMNSRLDQRSFDCVAAIAVELLQRESPDDENGIACALLGAMSNISCRLSHKTEFLHEKLGSFDVWWNESLWLTWLSRFIASELVSCYNGKKPEIEKEPGKSMELLTELLSSPSAPVEQIDEQSRIVQCCLACIDLMLSCLLQSANKDKSSDCITLVTTVITKTAVATCLTNSQTQQLVDSIVAKFELNENQF